MTLIDDQKKLQQALRDLGNAIADEWRLRVIVQWLSDRLTRKTDTKDS